MARPESYQPGQEPLGNFGQIVERNSQGFITRIKEDTSDTRFMYVGGKLVEKVMNVGVGSFDLGFSTSYFYRTTETGREMILEMIGTQINKDKSRLPVGFTDAAVWIPAQSDKARFDFVYQKDGNVNPNPVVCDAYRREYRLIGGPMIDLETSNVLLRDEETALVPDRECVSYFDSEGEEVILDPFDTSDNSREAFIKEHFPAMISWP